MKFIANLQKLAEALIKIDNSGPDCKITITEFDKIKDDKELLHTLTNTDTIVGWEEFKSLFTGYQSKEFGFEWGKGKGQSGTLILNKITLPAQVGEEIAKKLMSESRQEGFFNETVEEFLGTLYEYLEKCKFDKKNLDLTFVKDSFAAPTTISSKNERFKFSTRSNKFQLGVAQYVYDKSEVALGKVIEESLRELLQLETLYHKQEQRKHRKYQNVDFEGYRIIRTLSGDEIEVINVELKPSNKIESVSEAISQSINYKEKAQKTYIAIPLFDPRNFYDTGRFYNFVKLCEENEIGIISISMDPQSHKVIGLDIVLEAPKRGIQNYDIATELLQIDKKEYCVLCRKIVASDDRLRNCGWSIPTENDQSICMKNAFERSVIKN